MSVGVMTCFFVKCDGCGSHFEEGDYSPPHYESEKAALEAATDGSPFDGYFGQLGTRHYCASCCRRVEHEHDWYMHRDKVARDDDECMFCGIYREDAAAPLTRPGNQR